MLQVQPALVMYYPHVCSFTFFAAKTLVGVDISESRALIQKIFRSYFLKLWCVQCFHYRKILNLEGDQMQAFEEKQEEKQQNSEELVLADHSNGNAGSVDVAEKVLRREQPVNFRNVVLENPDIAGEMLRWLPSVPDPHRKDAKSDLSAALLAMERPGGKKAEKGRWGQVKENLERDVALKRKRELVSQYGPDPKALISYIEAKNPALKEQQDMNVWVNEAPLILEADKLYQFKGNVSPEEIVQRLNDLSHYYPHVTLAILPAEKVFALLRQPDEEIISSLPGAGANVLDANAKKELATKIRRCALLAWLASGQLSIFQGRIFRNLLETPAVQDIVKTLDLRNFARLFIAVVVKSGELGKEVQGHFEDRIPELAKLDPVALRRLERESAMLDPVALKDLRNKGWNEYLDYMVKNFPIVLKESIETGSLLKSLSVHELENVERWIRVQQEDHQWKDCFVKGLLRTEQSFPEKTLLAFLEDNQVDVELKRQAVVLWLRDNKLPAVCHSWLRRECAGNLESFDPAYVGYLLGAVFVLQDERSLYLSEETRQRFKQQVSKLHPVTHNRLWYVAGAELYSRYMARELPDLLKDDMKSGNFINRSRSSRDIADIARWIWIVGFRQDENFKKCFFEGLLRCDEVKFKEFFEDYKFHYRDRDRGGAFTEEQWRIVTGRYHSLIRKESQSKGYNGFFENQTVGWKVGLLLCLFLGTTISGMWSSSLEDPLMLLSSLATVGGVLLTASFYLYKDKAVTPAIKRFFAFLLLASMVTVTVLAMLKAPILGVAPILAGILLFGDEICKWWREGIKDPNRRDSINQLRRGMAGLLFVVMFLCAMAVLIIWQYDPKILDSLVELFPASFFLKAGPVITALTSCVLVIAGFFRIVIDDVNMEKECVSELDEAVYQAECVEEYRNYEALSAAAQGYEQMIRRVAGDDDMSSAVKAVGSDPAAAARGVESNGNPAAFLAGPRFAASEAYSPSPPTQLQDPLAANGVS